MPCRKLPMLKSWLHQALKQQLAGPCSLQRCSVAVYQSQLFSTAEHEKPKLLEESMDFPGGKVPFTNKLKMTGGPQSSAPPMSCYRTVDSTGAHLASADIPHQISQDLATKIYEKMAALQIVDTVFYEAQRQCRADSLSS